jgi:hypothetical protein
MQKVGEILKKFDPTEDKYVSREFQTYAVYLTEKLGDAGRKSLYMKLAKTLPRPALAKALKFVIDSRARNKGALFMWKLKEMGVIGRKKSIIEKSSD